jgi:hypothetical protein
MKFIRSKTDAGKNIISRDQLRKLVSERLKGKLGKKFCLHMADVNYYLPPKKDIDKIINGSKMKETSKLAGNVRGERFDCDDFALLLKARFSYAAYRDKKYPNIPHCFGIVWGLLPFPFPHSLNWYVTDDHQLWFVEPQRHHSFKPRARDKHINFMMV